MTGEISVDGVSIKRYKGYTDLEQMSKLSNEPYDTIFITSHRNFVIKSRFICIQVSIKIVQIHQILLTGVIDSNYMGFTSI